MQRKSTEIQALRSLLSRISPGGLILGLLLIVTSMVNAGETRTPIIDSTASDGQTFLGEQIGRKQQFLIRRHRNGRAEIAVEISGHVIYTMSDIAINKHSPSGVTQFAPGQTYKGYEFYLSPDLKYLFVVRGLAVNLCTAYMFRKSTANTMLQVTNDGERLDVAALKAYARQKGLNYIQLINGAENAQFIKWKGHDEIEFWLYASSDLQQPDSTSALSTDTNVTYNLRNHSFTFSPSS
jgi:hypothetical protein